MNELSTLGFGPHFQQQLRAMGSVREIPARIAAEHRGLYEVWSRDGEGTAQLAGRLRLEPEQTSLPGTGDWVVLDNAPHPDAVALIERVLDRRTVFTRGAAGRRNCGQVVAANVDLVLLVCGLDEDYNLRRIERYLTRIWASGAQPVVLLNKADLCQDSAAREAEVARHAHAVPILRISALQREGMEGVRALIQPGQTVALVGSSGAGKSTLVNALVGEERMSTGGVRERDGRGCHVTTHRQLVLLPGGGLLLDTPGMRSLQLVDEEGLDTVFQDVTTLSRGCRYRDCRHQGEPGCAVQGAVADGVLQPERLEHFQKLEQEARAFERRHDARQRKREARSWGQRSDEVAQLRRWKGGKH